MRILEIGCGIEAGPYFDGAEEHIIVDHLDYLVDAAYETDERFTPVVGDATHIIELEDASIDIVLARNVFGDSGLNIHAPEKPSSRQSREEALQESSERKVALMNEAARLLINGGSLVVVEQYTPSVAEEFIRKINSGTLKSPDNLSRLLKVKLPKVTPLNYSKQHYIQGRTHTWVSNKLSA